MTDLPALGRPAERALENAGYTALEQLSGLARIDLLRLHGVGPRAIGLLQEALQRQGLEPLQSVSPLRP